MSIKYDHVKSHGNPRNIAYCHEIPNGAKLSILWLSGYCSVMNSTKASAISEWAQKESIEMIRFDYSGLGKSEGEFATANLSQWLDEALLIYQKIQHRPTIIIGSSMGAWLALRLTETLQRSHQTQPKALLLLAPAVDFTHEILLKKLPKDLLGQLENQGVIAIPSQYDEEPLKFYQQFIQDAQQHRLLNHPSIITTPITIIHGEQDHDIPIMLGIKVAAHFKNTQLFTINDGEHRLSRAQDLQFILNTLKNLIS
ncbi:alpha/beta fold hydrolase [Wohlfahrtiimonas larvae]|uniref:Alpha/beta hydrolase n=1 Tax=Wohlfahrtiimonas larvae TaxID=1157986 RepID=A0ABP9MPS1_9GAMM|nr:alpha/beta hydrolase [Wohlfahrtiimonas larvae]